MVARIWYQGSGSQDIVARMRQPEFASQQPGSGRQDLVARIWKPGSGCQDLEGRIWFFQEIAAHKRIYVFVLICVFAFAGFFFFFSYFFLFSGTPCRRPGPDWY